MKIQHLAAGIFWMAIGLFASVHAYQLGLGRLRQPGPGFIFFLSGLGLTCLSIANLVTSYRKQSKEGETGPPLWRGLRWHKALLVLAALAAFGCFLNIAGFLLSTFLLMVFLFKGVEPTKWWIAIASSLITILLSYLLFVKWLEVPFPMKYFGLWG